MNTIKIFLDQSGAVATLQKDFPLYQFQFNNKLLNIFIPTSILGATQFIDDNVNTGAACLIKMKYTMDWNGKTKESDAFLCRYVKTLTQNNIEYALFERTLPYAFTIFSGEGANAPQLTVMAVNIVEGTIISTVSAQPVGLDIMQSDSAFDIDDLVEPTAAQELQAQIDTLTEDLGAKQDKVDEAINPFTPETPGDPDTNDHSVVGNINKVLQDSAQNTEDIGDLQGDMTQAQTDIQNLYNMVEYGVNIVGTWTVQDSLPTDAQVSAKVEEITGNPPVRGQALIVKLDMTSGTDTIYFYVYDGTNWHHFEMQFLNDAENGVKGLIAGDYNASGLLIADNFMVDIQSGIIKNIYRVDASGNYTDFKTIADEVMAKLINGTAAVEMAKKDANGNNIANTYMTKSAGATKQYVQDYATPKALFDINYPDYATGEFKGVNVADNSYNKTTAVSSIGDTELAAVVKTLDADILLGDQNGAINRIWLVANITEGVKIRVETNYIDENSQEVSLAVQVSDTISLVSNIATLTTIKSVFTGLTTPITLPSGTQIVQHIYIVRESSTAASFILLSNTTYDAYMQLDKIGYVRYTLEEEPTAIITEADSTSIDSDGNLNVAGDGQMDFANGDTAEIVTLVKLPLDNTPIQNSQKLMTSGAIYNAFENEFNEKLAIVDVGTINKSLATTSISITQTQEDSLYNNDNAMIKFTVGGLVCYARFIRVFNNKRVYISYNPQFKYEITIDPTGNSASFEKKSMSRMNIGLAATSWVADSSQPGYNYKLVIDPHCVVNSYSSFVHVDFEIADIMSGNFAPYCYYDNSAVTIYAKVQPTTTLQVGLTIIN